MRHAHVVGFVLTAILSFAPATTSAGQSLPITSAAAEALLSVPRYQYGSTNKTGRQAQGIAVDPSAQRVYALANTNRTSDSSLIVIDETTQQILAQISVAPFARGVALDRQRHMIYVASNAQVQAIDGATDAVVASINVKTAGSIAVDSTTHAIYVTENATLHVIDGLTNVVTSNIATDYYGVSAPGGLAVNETTHRVFIGEWNQINGAHLAEIDPVTNEFVKSVALGDGIPSITVDQTRNVVYVATGNPCVVEFNPDTYATQCGPAAYVLNGTPGSAGIREVAIEQSTNTLVLLSTDNVSSVFFADPNATTSAYQDWAAGYAEGIDVDQTNGKIFIASIPSDGSDGSASTLWTSPLPTPPLPAGGQTVYRFWDSHSGAHFYTISLDERNQILRTYNVDQWKYEGAAYTAYATQMPGTVPLYRFFSNKYQGHFYTTSAAERDQVQATYSANEWNYEGVAFYVFAADTTNTGTLAVARFWSSDYRQHFYTANPAEAAFTKTHYPLHEWEYERDDFAVSSASSAVAPMIDAKNCTDFANWADARAWYSAYYPAYGDVARLDENNDGVPCEALPGHP